MRNKFIQLLELEAQKNSKIKLITGDLGYGVLDKFSNAFPDLFINCGIAEQSMIGIAGGLSAMGNKVFIYSIANFPTFRCLEQIRNDLVYMNNSAVIVSVGAGFSYGSQGYTHHGIEDLSIMRPLGDIEIFTPSDSQEIEIIFPKLVKSQKTCYLRLGKGGEELTNSVEIPGVFSLRRISAGSQDGNLKNICILACGPIAANLIPVSESLRKLMNLDCYSVIKLDKTEISDYFVDSKYDYIFTLEEHVLAGGFGSFINECLVTNNRNTQFVNLGIDAHKPASFGSQEYLRKASELDADSIIRFILETVEA
jgi:transketolase